MHQMCIAVTFSGPRRVEPIASPHNERCPISVEILETQTYVYLNKQPKHTSALTHSGCLQSLRVFLVSVYASVCASAQTTVAPFSLFFHSCSSETTLHFPPCLCPASTRWFDRIRVEYCIPADQKHFLVAIRHESLLFHQVNNTNLSYPTIHMWCANPLWMRIEEVVLFVVFVCAKDCPINQTTHQCAAFVLCLSMAVCQTDALSTQQQFTTII